MKIVKVQLVTPNLVDKILPLIADYQRFYRMTPSEARNRVFFRQLAEPGNPIGVQLVALDPDEAPLGFATLYFLPSSLSAGVSCVLNDLFTVHSTRGQGVGRALLIYARDYAEARGYGTLDWQTEKSNTVAQRLYDSLPASRSEWYYYSLPLAQGRA